jgi:tetratricopeptide (TPR) repeat protein
MLRKLVFLTLIFLTACVSDEEKEQKTEIQILSEKITENPTDITLLNDRVEYNQAKNNLESVLYDLKEIVRLDSLNTDNHLKIATIYFELSKGKNGNPKYPSLVKHHLEKSINLDSKNAEAFSLMGELLLAYGKFADAIKSFNTSLMINYNQEKSHMLMGYTFKQLNQIDNAINCFRNAVSVNPDFKEAHVQLGQIFHQLGDTMAIEYYNNALSITKDDELVLYNKALFYQDMLDWNNALDAYAELHKVNYTHSSAHYNLGFIHMELGLYDVAANNFSDAIYSNSEFFEAYYSRGNCFETLGNIAQAESDYKRAIEINPEYKYAIEALGTLQKTNKKYNK